MAGDSQIVAHGENLLGHIEQASGNPDGASELFIRSAEGFRTLGTPWGTGNAAHRHGERCRCRRRGRPGGAITG